jgi:hypothetical protein
MQALMRILCTGGALLPVLLLALGADRAQAQAWFATECQESFQYGWQSSLPKTWKRCSLFNAELNDTDLLYYYTDLQNSKYAWEDPADQFWIWSDRAVWAMWNYWELADSAQMRLGDEAWRLSILATYACETLKNSDNLLPTRLGPLFAGGLRFALGSHGTVWASSYTDEVGEDFADGLQKGKSLRYAWKDGNSDWWHDQDVAVATTGATSSDCYYRRSAMTWQNFHTFPRLQDWQIGWYCTNRWDNI